MFYFYPVTHKLIVFFKRYFLTNILSLFLLLSVTPVFAQNSNPLPVEQAFKLSILRQADNKIKFEWKIADGYYLYQDKIAVRQKEKALDFTLDNSAIRKDDPYFGVLNVYYNQANAIISVPSDLLTPLEVEYQGCQENGICYAATVKKINPLSLTVIGEEQSFNSPFGQVENKSSSSNTTWGVLSNTQKNSTNLENDETSYPADFDTSTAMSDISSNSSINTGITIAEDDGGMIGKLNNQGGIALVLASFVLFGILLAFTPCVFPMYPILAGAIAREGDNVTAKRGFSLSVVYVVAMASAFGLLGIVAAWSGQNLQIALQSPIAIILVSIIFVILALSMFGFFEIQLPHSWVNLFNKMGNGKRGSHTSAAILGFTSALIVGPCVTAPLVGALLYIAQTGNVVLGALALFALGIGKGIPLIIFGTIGPKALPKAGVWMNAVRQIFGFFFIAAAIYMLSRIVESSIIMVLWAILALVIAIWLLTLVNIKSTINRFITKAVALVFILYAIALGIGFFTANYDPLNPLARLMASNNQLNDSIHDFVKVTTADALRERVLNNDNKHTLVYVTADWCISCIVIEKTVLNNQDVINNLQPLNLIKFDVTKNTKEQLEVMQQLQVYGPPTMLFLSKNGVELADTRLIGEITKNDLIETVQKVEKEK